MANAGKVRQTARGVWDKNESYDVLDVVMSKDKRAAYVAKKTVPTGTSVTNTDYWDELINVDLDAVENRLDEIYRVNASINLFDVNNSENVNGKFLNRNGTVYTVDGYMYSHPIQVTGGKIYFVTVNPDLSADYVAAFYTVDGAVLGSTAPTKTEDELWWKLTAPEQAGYMRVDSDKNRKAVLMVVQSEEEPDSEYVPFYSAGSGKLADLDAKTNALTKETEILKGKKLVLNGDSICYGAGATGGYGRIIADRCGMSLQNVAVSGATVTANVYAEDGTTARHWISRTISNMDADADYVILEGGVNDASLGVAMGTLNLSNYTAILDDTTFCGAFESMLKQSIIRFSGAKIFYLAVHKMSTKYSSNTDDGYYQNALKLCRKWGVPVIDLNVCTPPLGMYVEDESLVALREKYTNDGDGWHPNEEGYKKYYCDQIIAALKSGLSNA